MNDPFLFLHIVFSCLYDIIYNDQSKNWQIINLFKIFPFVCPVLLNYSNAYYFVNQHGLNWAYEDG